MLSEKNDKNEDHYPSGSNQRDINMRTHKRDKSDKKESSTYFNQNVSEEERYFHEQNELKERQRREEFERNKTDHSIEDYISAYEMQHDERFKENSPATNIESKKDNYEHVIDTIENRTTSRDDYYKKSGNNAGTYPYARTNDEYNRSSEEPTHGENPTRPSYESADYGSSEYKEGIAHENDHGYFSQTTLDEEKAYRERMNARPSYDSTRSAYQESPTYDDKGSASYDTEETIIKARTPYTAATNEETQYDSAKRDATENRITSTSKDDYYKNSTEEPTYGENPARPSYESADYGPSEYKEGITHENDHGYFSQTTLDEEKAYRERMDARPSYDSAKSAYPESSSYDGRENTSYDTEETIIKARTDHSANPHDELHRYSKPYSESSDLPHVEEDKYHNPDIRELQLVHDTFVKQPEHSTFNPGYYNQNTLEEERAYQERMDAKPEYNPSQKDFEMDRIYRNTQSQETVSGMSTEERVIRKSGSNDFGKEEYKGSTSQIHHLSDSTNYSVDSMHITPGMEDIRNEENGSRYSHPDSDFYNPMEAFTSTSQTASNEGIESGIHRRENSYSEEKRIKTGHTRDESDAFSMRSGTYHSMDNAPLEHRGSENPYEIEHDLRNSRRPIDNQGYYSQTTLEEERAYQESMSAKPGIGNAHKENNFFDDSRGEKRIHPFDDQKASDPFNPFSDEKINAANGTGSRPESFADEIQERKIIRTHGSQSDLHEDAAGKNVIQNGDIKRTTRTSGAKDIDPIAETPKQAKNRANGYFNSNTQEAEREFLESRGKRRDTAGDEPGNGDNLFFHTWSATDDDITEPHSRKRGMEDDTEIPMPKKSKKVVGNGKKTYQEVLYQRPNSFGAGSKRTVFQQNLQHVKAAGTIYGSPASIGIGNPKEAQYAGNLFSQYDVIEGKEPTAKNSGKSISPYKSCNIGSVMDARNFRSKNLDVNNSREVNQFPNTIASLEKSFVRAGSRFIFDAGTVGTTTRIGYDIAKDFYGTIAIVVARKALKIQANSLRNSLNMELFINSLENVVGNMKSAEQAEKILEQFGLSGVYTHRDTQKALKAVNFILERNGMAPIELGKGNTRLQIFRYMRKNKAALTPELKLFLKEFGKIAADVNVVENLRRGLPNPVVNLLFHYIARYARQVDAGAGALLILNVMGKTRSTIRAGITLIKRTAALGKLTALTTMKVAAWAAAKAAQTKAGQAVTKTVGKGTKAVVNQAKKVLPAGNPQKKILRKKKRKRIRKKAGRFRERTGRFVRKTRDFYADPFHLRAKKAELTKKLADKFFSSKVGRIFSPIRIINQAINKAIALVISVISAIISAILLFILIILVAMLLVLAVATIITTIMGLFDFTSNEDEIIDSALATIKQCYEAQNTQITSSSASYRNVNIQYTDVKDQDVYNSSENQPDSPFTETTNSAELISMATVYFDFDLEDAGKEKVNDYITKLYNGSHLLSIIEHPHEEELEDGTKVTYVDADITLTTYYFNSLFNCKLTSSAGFLQTGTIAAGTVIEIPQDFEQCVTRTDYDKIKWNRATGQGVLFYNNWIPQGRKFDDGIAYLECNGEKRYLIAVASTFGTVGDYVDVYFADGSVLPCIIADAKSNSDPNITQWGHRTGNAISVLEMETEYARAKSSATGNPGNADWWPRLGQKVTKIVNGGSYFSNPNGPQK